MHKRRLSPRPAFSVLAACLLVVVLALGFGQVLGHFYLKNLTGGSDAMRSPANAGAKDTSSKDINSKDSGGKKKILRLNKFEFYTVEAASRQDEESALSIGKALAQKGFAPVVTSLPPYRVLLGLADKAEALQALADTISIDGQKAVVVKGVVNDYAYRFSADDSFAAEKTAPFLGAASTCLETALPLYSGLTGRETEKNSQMTVQVQELATLLEKTYLQGTSVIQANAQDSTVAELTPLVKCLKDWSSNAAGPQYALAALDAYCRFLYTVNL